jgi:hypothetical protein
MSENKDDLSARWEWVLERAAKDLGISVGELKRRLVPPKLRVSEVERARARGAAEWEIEAIKNCGTDFIQSVVKDQQNAPRGPGYQVPTSQPVSNVRGPGGGTGWGYVAPIKNGIGQGK